LKLNWLLLFIPIAIALDWFGVNPVLVFLASALAIVPLAGLMGDATEALAEYLGPTLGGLLNATLGNAPEIIISLFALHRGLIRIVKSSLTGSIIGNLLFGLGVSMFAGGLKVKSQTFDSNVARMNGALLILASFGLVIPAFYRLGPGGIEAGRHISREISVILFAVYVGSLVYTLVTNRPVVGKFAGVFVLALVGNAAELLNAVRYARKDKMDLAIGVTVGASTQVALLVAPILVFASYFMGQDMNLLFTQYEVWAVMMAVFITRILIYDGNSTWLEGLMLIAIYFMLAIGFFHLPPEAVKAP
jgi:Ca2+:H+ antiporter